MKKLIHAIITLIAVAIFSGIAGCSGNTDTMRIMDHADSIMESNPDSALIIMQSLDTASLAEGEEKARYALLMSMALDKSYIDVADDSLINIAHDFYKSNMPNYDMMRTFYYKARIGYNSGEYDNAIKYALRSIEAASQLQDSLWVARTNEVAAYIYSATFAYHNAVRHRSVAAEKYKEIGRKYNELYSKGDMALEISSLKDFEKSSDLIDSLIHVSMSEMRNDSALQAHFLSYSLRIHFYGYRYDKALEAWKKRMSYIGVRPISVSDGIEATCIMLHFDDITGAENMLDNIAREHHSTDERIHILSLKYSIHRAQNNNISALAMADSLFSILDEEFIGIADNPALEARGDFHFEQAIASESVSKGKSITIGLLFLMIFLIIVGWISFTVLIRRFRVVFIRRRSRKISLMEDLILRFGNEIGSVREKVSRLEDDKNSLIAEKDSISSKIDELNEYNISLRQEMEEKCRRINALTEEKDRLAGEKSDMAKRILDVTAEKDQLLGESEHIRLRLEHSVSEKEKLMADNTRISTEIQELSRQITILNDSIYGSKIKDDSTTNGQECHVPQNEEMRLLLGSYVEVLNSLCVQYFPEEYSNQLSTLVKEKLDDELKILIQAKNDGIFVALANMLHDGIIDKIRAADEKISEDDVLFLALISSKLNHRIIAMITGIKYNNVASKKKRLFEKLAKMGIVRFVRS